MSSQLKFLELVKICMIVPSGLSYGLSSGDVSNGISLISQLGIEGFEVCTYVTQCSCRYVPCNTHLCKFHLHRAKCYMDSTLLRRTPTNVKSDKLLGFTNLITLFKGVQSSTRTVTPSQYTVVRARCNH